MLAQIFRNRTRVRLADAEKGTQTRRVSGNTWKITRNQRRRCPTCHWHRTARLRLTWLKVQATRGTIRFLLVRGNSNKKRERRSFTPRNRIIERIRLRSLTRTRTRTCSRRIYVRSIGFPWTLTAIKSTCRSNLWNAFSSTMSARQDRTWTVQVREKIHD